MYFINKKIIYLPFNECFCYKQYLLFLYALKLVSLPLLYAVLPMSEFCIVKVNTVLLYY